MWWHNSVRILNWPLDPVQRNNVSIKSLILDLTALQSLFPEQAQISHCSHSSHLPTELMEETLQEQEQNSWYHRVFTTSGLIKKNQLEQTVKIRGWQSTCKRNLSWLVLLLLQSIQTGTWMPTRLQVKPVQSRSDPELGEKKYYYLPVLLFSIYRMGVGCHMEADRAPVFRTGNTTY